MHTIKCLIPTLILFCLLDCLWLGSIGKGFYLSNLGNMLLMKGQAITPRMIPAVIVYVLFAIMLWYMVLPLANDHIAQSFLYGALAGFVVYGIYDMTNLAVLKDWTLAITLIDWLWGCFLCSVTSGFCAYLNQVFK